MQLLQQRYLPTATPTDPAADTHSAITLTAVTFILLILAVGAVVSTSICIAERKMYSNKQKH
jgi:hypothetical protein